MLGVERLIGIPNYDNLFKDFRQGAITGITSAHEIRISATSDGENVQVHYKEYVTEDGWYPRPVLPTEELKDDWKYLFPPDDVKYGNPVSFISKHSF